MNSALLGKAALKIGIPVESFNSWIWIVDDGNVAIGGTTAKPSHPADIFVSAQRLRPNVFCHEMTHSFGLFRHALSHTMAAITGTLIV